MTALRHLTQGARVRRNRSMSNDRNRLDKAAFPRRGGAAWSGTDYLLGAGVAAGYAAMIPFFWAPPFWVISLLARQAADPSVKSATPACGP